MIKQVVRLFAGILLTASLFLPHQAAQAQSNGVLREVYTGIPGVAVSDLTSHPKFPDNPDFEGVLTDFFEAPTDVLDDYGQRCRALIIPPVSGSYTFWIASDDGGALFLSTDETAANRQQIASVPEWTASREWNKYPEQESSAISLTAGQQYYIEALMKEGGGGDNLAVGWRLPNGTLQRPIPAEHLVIFGLGPPNITQHPQNLTVTEGETATFQVEVSRTFGIAYQWRRNGADIPGATNATYAVTPATLADDGAVFRCFLVNSQGDALSNPAMLTVQADSTPPTVSSVVNLGDPRILTVRFSEPVEESSAGNTANYSINQGVTINSASLINDQHTVVLRTSLLSQGVNYTLTVNNVRDRASTPNTIDPNTQRNFSLNYSPLPIERIRGQREPLGPSSRTTGLVISEIMYHPRGREDGRNGEFVEIHNTEPTPTDISGYRLSGTIDFTFPPNTILSAKAFLVVASVPADVEAIHDITGVIGPFDGNLSNSGGTLRLRNRSDAVLLEVEYDDDAPWPVEADGAGHSLVLSRPSYGEADPRAWAASDRVGGSPGADDPVTPNPWRTVLINEFLAHTDDPQVDFVELYNYRNTAVDLGGCILTDNHAVDKFIIPAGTSIPARGFLFWDQNQLGFALSTLGEEIFLKSPDGSRVLDAVRFGATDNGVSTGRFPDGHPLFSELANPTPGADNTPFKARTVVINELMYNPISRDDDDEFVELHNDGDAPVDVSGWRLMDGIQFTIPTNTVIAPDGYLVIARNAAQLLNNHPSLDPAIVVGDYNGQLSNSGERIALGRFDTTVTTNNDIRVTNVIHIVVDEVSYRDGGRWGIWADGDGSSLERVDPQADGRLASNWADSDESAKSEWTSIEHTGVLDNGNGAIDELHVLLIGSGEALIDDLEVIPSGGQNLVPNGTFDSGLEGWVIQGNHVQSTLSPPGAGFNASRALHLRASGSGDNGANRVEIDLNSPMSAGQVATIRGKARWLAGHPDLLLRLHGNHLEAVGNLQVPSNLGSPGAPNSRRLPNAGPAIDDVTHNPILPSANQPVVVSARVHDPDGIAALNLHYRVDPSTNFTTLTMTYRGAGYYSATLPGQSSGSLIAFHIEATDAHPTDSTSTRFPNDAPTRECLVRFGEPANPGGFGTYRLWITQDTIDTWSQREKLSNESLDATFVYGNTRVIYNAGARYRGSPFIRPGYNSPVGNLAALVYRFHKDDLMLGSDKFNLDWLEQPGRDNTLQREKMSFWIADQLDVPFSYQRYVYVFINGLRRGLVYTDSQQPDSEYLRSWFPDDDLGEMYKIDDWFEFNDSVLREFNVDARLQIYATTGGEKKQARYRWNWEKRPNRTLDDDYSQLFDLVDALNTPGTDPYNRAVENLVDVEQWMRVFAARRIVADWDGYGYNRGKNMFAYKPGDSGWQMLLWDLDFSLGGGSDSPTHSLFQVNDPTIARFYAHPPFARAYWRAFEDAVNGPLLPSVSDPVMDANYAAFVANNLSVDSPSAIKSWIASRRNYILQQLATVDSPFAITSNNGNNFSTPDNLVTLSGTAPIAVKTILINGVAYTPDWSDINSWSLRIALNNAVNSLSIQGLDLRSNPIAGASDSITITYTGQVALPEDFLVINELMYNPVPQNAEFLELLNLSPSFTFDLSNFRLNGLAFRFPGGSLIHPGQYLVVAENASGFVAAYGNDIPLAGIYDGRLDNSGERIQLLRPGASPDEEILVDEVTYDDLPPWPSRADGFGPSLQLIDPTQDNNRVANWFASNQEPGTNTQQLVSITHNWKYNQSGSDLGTTWRAPGYNDTSWPSGDALLYVEDADLPAPKNTLLTLGPMTYYFRGRFDFSGNPSAVSLSITTVIDDGAIFYLNGQELFRLGMPDGPISASDSASRVVDNATFEGPFMVPASALIEGENVLAVEVHQTNPGSSDIVFGMSVESIEISGAPFTPGAPNSVPTLAVIPPLWLNEIQPNNLTGPQDGAGERDPWVELHNSGSSTISLNGFHLSDDYEAPLKWAFPSGASIQPGQFLIVWLDGDSAQSTPDELHAGFQLSPTAGSIVLTRVVNGTPVTIDYLNFPTLLADRSYGAFPDGTPTHRQRFFIATPGDPNTTAFPETPVKINEWLAANSTTLIDPADGNYDDWFELFNEGPEPVDLSGFTLTDDLSNPAKWTIPNGTVIPANGYLLVWADGHPHQNSPDIEALHADFSLSRNGEAIGLFAPNGEPVDTVTFGPQTDDISHGRWPDGNVEPFHFMTTPTPGAANIVENPDNTPPSIDPIDPKTVNEGSQLAFTVSASDPDPGQSLTFDLPSGAPAGATINPDSGVFTWTPSEAQGPGVYNITIRVTDDGSPPLSDTSQVQVTVNEVNQPPTLASIGNQTVTVGTELSFTAVGSDVDIPAQTLTYSLEPGAPSGASINPSTGLFSWTPSAAHASAFHSITVVVTDNGTPPLNAARTFSVAVHDSAAPQITDVRVSSENVLTVTWTTTPDATYRVETTSDLANGPWSMLEDNLSATGDTLSVDDDITPGESIFYRVVLEE